jgi:hypothetical protein
MILGLSLTLVLGIGGCRTLAGFNTKLPIIPMPAVNILSGFPTLGSWIDGGVFNIYTGNGHYDGKRRWDDFTANWQQIQNFFSIHFWNYDVRDPFAGAPYFGDPR